MRPRAVLAPSDAVCAVCGRDVPERSTEQWTILCVPCGMRAAARIARGESEERVLEDMRQEHAA